MNDQNLALVEEARNKYFARKHEDALADLDAAMRRGADGYDVWLLRENLLFELERAGEALEAANRLIELEPENPEGYEAKAGVLVYLLDDFKNGELFARKAYSLLPEQADENVHVTGNSVFSLLTHVAEKKGQLQLIKELQQEGQARGFGLDPEDSFGRAALHENKDQAGE